MKKFRYIRTTIQVLALCMFYWILQYIVDWLNLPIPASVVGMVILTFFLITDVVPLSFIEDGAQLLLKILPIMFVPDGVALFFSGQLFKNNLFMLVLMFLFSTVLVMGSTALASLYMQKQKEKKQIEYEQKAERRL